MPDQGYLDAYGMARAAFRNDIPPKHLYYNRRIEDALGRAKHAARNNGMALVIGDSGVGKSTTIRTLCDALPSDQYLKLYLAESKLTPRWLYDRYLGQLGLSGMYYRGDSKALLLHEFESITTNQGKRIVCILDEAHRLEKDTIEEFRFFLNNDFDSRSSLSLILCGQTELWTDKLRMKSYTAIRDRITQYIVLKPLDRSEMADYIDAELDYAGGRKDLFTDKALDIIYTATGGVPRQINMFCNLLLQYGAQNNKRVLDDHDAGAIASNEMPFSAFYGDDIASKE